jgi:DnaK suppressor protein
MTAKSRQQRTARLREMLETKRRELSSNMRGMIRDVRLRAESGRNAPDPQDGEVDIEDDLELAMIQMNSEMLHRIDAALRRLDAGRYGVCADCSREIPDGRLHALPFAVRCVECEQNSEARPNRRPGVAGRAAIDAVD